MNNDYQELNEALTRFGREMYMKLHSKREHGFTGWNDPQRKNDLANKLQQHVTSLILGDTKQAVDIANLAMFLWWMEQKETNNET